MIKMPFSPNLKGALVAAMLVITGVPAAAHAGPPTEACRDCPFPLRISDGRWLMPSGKTEVQIDRSDIDKRVEMVHVRLRDARTHELLATGSAKHVKYHSTMILQLLERDGGKVRAEIHFINADRDVIQVKFTCEDECSIAEYLN